MTSTFIGQAWHALFFPPLKWKMHLLLLNTFGYSVIEVPWILNAIKNENSFCIKYEWILSVHEHYSFLKVLINTLPCKITGMLFQNAAKSSKIELLRHEIASSASLMSCLDTFKECPHLPTSPSVRSCRKSGLQGVIAPPWRRPKNSFFRGERPLSPVYEIRNFETTPSLLRWRWVFCLSKTMDASRCTRWLRK